MELDGPIAAIFFAVAVYYAYWFVKALRFYRNNGWDFSVAFGPKVYSGEYVSPEREMKPRGKLFFGYPFIIFVAGTLAVVAFVKAL
ncbi:MAG TPA: hypothetical protein VGO04_02090 [Ensifer sp.]|jgi:hypothetical protein|uniref:hypothetical protein n=1 Tax=Ensifer sp. TaxID=1872086 RepID=UPI002E156AF5|nr:hypothetical protein [Ensifer sp.]